MIARVWRGITSKALADDYLQHLRETAMPALRGASGLRRAYTLRRAQGDQCEFQLITIWESEQAMRDWAGDDPQRAIYYDEDDRFLLDMEPLVRLYEIADELAFVPPAG